MKIAKAGREPLLLGLAVAGAGALPIAGAGRWVVVALGLGFACFCAYFFRDPERPSPRDPGLLYSPGDGRVLSVAHEGQGGATTVRVFLSIFDVHVQRAPCSGTVSEVRRQPGAFALAMAKEAALNERAIVSIAPGGGRPTVVVEQIAGFIARRIECWVGPGDAVAAGERYGIIHFGSQVALHLPPGCRPLVAAGDRVKGGVTPVGEWTGSS